MGSIVCFALFLGAVGVCLAEGWQLMLADVVIVLGLGCLIYKKYNTKFLYYV